MDQSRRKLLGHIGVAGFVAAFTGWLRFGQAAPKEQDVFSSSFVTDEDMSWPMLHACYLIPATAALAEAIHEQYTGDMRDKLVTIEIKVHRR